MSVDISVAVLYAVLMSTEVSQVGAALFPSFQHFLSLNLILLYLFIHIRTLISSYLYLNVIFIARCKINLQPGCVNTTEVDIKKACRVSKPLRSSRHLQLGVAGGRISPSTSETDLASPTEAVKRHIAMLKQRLDRRNIKVSKVAEA